MRHSPTKKRFDHVVLELFPCLLTIFKTSSIPLIYSTLSTTMLSCTYVELNVYPPNLANNLTPVPPLQPAGITQWTLNRVKDCTP